MTDDTFPPLSLKHGPNNIKLSYKRHYPENMEGKHENCIFSNYDYLDLTYQCLKSEVCCKYGCCTTPLKKLSQMWYFWLILIFICILILTCMQYAKKHNRALELRRNLPNRSNLRLNTASRRCQHLHNRNGHGELELREAMATQHRNFLNAVEVHRELHQQQTLSRLLSNRAFLDSTRIASRCSAARITSPPDYNSLAKSPDFTEPPPQYNAALKLLQDNEAINNIADTKELVSNQDVGNLVEIKKTNLAQRIASFNMYNIAVTSPQNDPMIATIEASTDQLLQPEKPISNAQSLQVAELQFPRVTDCTEVPIFTEIPSPSISEAPWLRAELPEAQRARVADTQILATNNNPNVNNSGENQTKS